MVSLCWWQQGQIGESAFWIWCKCLFKGACPDHSWNSRLACLHSILDICLLNLSDGSIGSICFICSYHGDLCHTFAATHFSFTWNVCQAADLLHGSIFCSCEGSFWFVLDPCLAAAVASLSASSFPLMLMCMGIHHWSVVEQPSRAS